VPEPPRARASCYSGDQLLVDTQLADTERGQCLGSRRCSMPDHLCETLVQRRERYGFSYWGVPDEAMVAFGPVVARLSGT
jgi:hypothetical protein